MFCLSCSACIAICIKCDTFVYLFSLTVFTDKELLRGKSAAEPILERDKEQHKLSFNTSPLKESHSSNTKNEDFMSEQVLPRKSKACTDLIKEWKETKKNKKLTRISIIPSADAENIPPCLAQHDHARYSISNADVGCPVQESTRIHSRHSIDKLLNDSEDSIQSCKGASQSELCEDLKHNITEEDSFKQLNIKRKCDRFSDDEVTDSLSLLKINRSKPEETQLYFTAQCEVLEQDLSNQAGMEETEEKQIGNGMGANSSEELGDTENISEGPVESLDRTSFVEIKDASAQVEFEDETCLPSFKSEFSNHLESASVSSQNDSEQYSSDCSKRDSFCEEIAKVTDVQSQVENQQLQKSNDSSYIEMEDVSLQTSAISPSQKQTEQEIESDAFYVEVEERSLQTSTTHCSQWEDAVPECDDHQDSVPEKNSNQSLTESSSKESSVCNKKTTNLGDTNFSSDEDTASDKSTTFERKKVNLKVTDRQVEQRNKETPTSKLMDHTEKVSQLKLKNWSDLDDSLPDLLSSGTQNQALKGISWARTAASGQQTPSKVTAQYAEFSSDSENDGPRFKDTGVHRFEGVLSSDSDVDVPDIKGKDKEKSTDVLSSDSDDFMPQRKCPEYAKKTACKTDHSTDNDHWR